MSEPKAPLVGEELIEACAKAIRTRNSHTATIQARQNEIAAAIRNNQRREQEIVDLTTQIDALQPQIEAMQEAIRAGQAYTPPAAKP